LTVPSTFEIQETRSEDALRLSLTGDQSDISPPVMRVLRLVHLERFALS